MVTSAPVVRSPNVRVSLDEIDWRLASAETDLTYVDCHAYGRLDGAECSSLATALANVRGVRFALRSITDAED